MIEIAIRGYPVFLVINPEIGETYAVLGASPPTTPPVAAQVDTADPSLHDVFSRECTICLEPCDQTAEGDSLLHKAVFIADCRHPFHRDCIEKFALSLKNPIDGTTCPNCRAPFKNVKHYNLPGSSVPDGADSGLAEGRAHRADEDTPTMCFGPQNVAKEVSKRALGCFNWFCPS